MADALSPKNGVASPEIGAVDSLAQAIDELRMELLSWIDSELSRLEGWQRGEDRSMDERSGVSSSIRPRPRKADSGFLPTHLEDDGPGTPDDTPGTGRGVTRSRGWPDEQDPDAGVDERRIAAGGPAMEPEPRSTPSNPRERLDALARRLDRRIKQAAGATEKGDSTVE